MEDFSLSTIPLTPDHKPLGSFNLERDTTPNLGMAESFSAAAKSSILLDNPAAIGFRAVRNGMADFYASEIGKQAFGTGFSEGKITEEEYKAIYHAQHPGMIGKWKEGMSHLRADYMMGDLELRDELEWRSAADHNPYSAVAGGLAGGLIDPSTALTFGGGASTAATLSAARRLGFSGVQRLGMASAKLRGAAGRGFMENAIGELPTAYIQESFLKEDRTLADTAVSLAAGGILPVGLELGGVALGRAMRRTTALRREDIARAAMGEKLPEDLNSNLKTNAGEHIQAFQHETVDAMARQSDDPLYAPDPTARVLIPKLHEFFSNSRALDDVRTHLELTSLLDKMDEALGSVASDTTDAKARRLLLAREEYRKIFDATPATGGATNAPNVVTAKAKETLLEIKAAFEDMSRKETPGEQWAAKKVRQSDRNRKIESEKKISETAAAARQAQSMVDNVGGAQARRLASTSSVDFESNLRARDSKSVLFRSVDGKSAKQMATWVKFWNEFVGRTGREVRYFDPANPLHKALFGDGLGAAHFSDAGTVYVSIDQLQSFDQLAGVIGHEIGHTVLYRSFTEWDNVVKAIVDSNDPDIAKALRTSLEAFGKSSAFRAMSKSKQMDEVIANVFGQVFQSRAFWKKYTDLHGASAFQRLSEFVRRVLKDIAMKLKGHGPELERASAKLYSSVTKAAVAVDDAFTPQSVDILASQRTKIHDEYGSRFWSLVNRLDEEDLDAIAHVDEFIDSTMTELPQEAADTKSYVANHKGHTVLGSGFTIPLANVPAFRRLSQKERASTVQGLLANDKLPYKKTFDAQMSRAIEARKESMAENAGEPGAPLVIYEYGAKGLVIKFAYPDSANPIKTRIEQSFSHSRALIQDWFSDFGFNVLHEEGNFQSGLTQAAQDLQGLANYTRSKFFYGTETKADLAYANGSVIDPLVQEFFYSKEFKELFDVDPNFYSADGKSLGPNDTGKGTRSKENPQNDEASSSLHDAFIEATQAFKSRKVNEALADDSPIPGALDAWQDRVIDFTQTRHEFMTDEQIKSAEAVAGLRKKASEGSRPSHAQMFDQVLEQLLGSIHAARGQAQEMTKVIPSNPVTLDAPTRKALAAADEQIAFVKEFFGYTFSGKLDDVRAELANTDHLKQKYTAAIDTPSSDRRIPDWIYNRYFDQVPENSLYGDNVYLDMMDMHMAETMDNVVKDRATHLQVADDLLRSHKDAIALAKPEDRPALTNAFVKARSKFIAECKTFTTEVVEIDGVSHTRAEHETFAAMREVWGDALVNRWIVWDSAKERTDHMDKATVAEYKRRSAEDSRRLRVDKGLSVETHLSDMTPARQDVAELKAQQAEAKSAFEENPFHSASDMVEAENAFNEADMETNPLAAQTYADGMDHMARPDELVKQLDDNRKAEHARLAPFLKDPVAALKKALPVFFPSGGKASTLAALIDKAETSSRYMKEKTADFLKQSSGATAFSLEGLNRSFLSDEVKGKAVRAVLEGKAADEVRKVIQEASDIEADHNVNRAKLNYNATAEGVFLGTHEQIYTSLDAQSRRGGTTLQEKLWNGKVLTSGSSLDVKMTEARTNVTFGINKALDDIPDLGMTGASMATVLKQAVDSKNGKSLANVPAEVRPLFVKLGQEIGMGLELARGYINEAGGRIAKNDQFLFSLRHNLSKIRRDAAAWKTALMAGLDWNKVELNAGLRKGTLTSADSRVAFLDNMLAEIEMAERSPESHPFDADKDNLAGRDLRHRVLAFKDDSTMIDYDVEFGSGDPMVEMISQLNSRAERSVLMKQFGPDYHANFNHILDATRSIPTTRGARLAYQLQERNMRIAFDGYAGLLNNPVNQRVAVIGQYVRLAANAAWGWMSTPSSMTDLAGLSKELRLSGATKYTNLFGDYLKNMATNGGNYSDDVKALFQGNLAGTEAILSSHTRMNVGAGERGFVANANKWIFTKNGQRRHTTVLQYAFTDIMAHHFGDMANAIKAGTDIGPGFRRWLANYKIEESDFALMAAHADEAQLRVGGDTKTVLLPSMVKDKALRDKLTFALKDSMDYAILQPSGSDNALLTFGLRSGTVAGEAIRCVSQYKGFAMAMNRKNRRRWRAYELDPDSMGTRRIHQAAYGAHLMAMGLLATQLKDVLAGKEPLTFVEDEQQNWNNLHRVVLQAGLFTVMQDLGVSVSNDNQDGWSLGLSSMAAGPMPGQALRFFDQLSNGSLATAARTAVNTTPFASVPFHNTLKHVVVGGLISDAYQESSDNVVRSMQSRTGQTNYLDSTSN